jgi:hypothetical protein
MLRKEGYKDYKKTLLIYSMVWSLEQVADYYNNIFNYFLKSTSKKKISQEVFNIYEEINRLKIRLIELKQRGVDTSELESSIEAAKKKAFTRLTFDFISNRLKVPKNKIEEVAENLIFDGISDNIEIQQAINACFAINGGNILIKGGTYDIQSDILGTDDITLDGVKGSTILKRHDNMNVSQAMHIIDINNADNFEIKKYEEATGKSVVGKNLVTLVREKDVKDMITLFLLERAWPLADVPPETRLKEENIVKIIEDAEKASIDEIYALASERLNMTKDDVNKLLDLLKNEEKIDTPSAGYVKIV